MQTALMFWKGTASDVMRFIFSFSIPDQFFRSDKIRNSARLLPGVLISAGLLRDPPADIWATNMQRYSKFTGRMWEDIELARYGSMQVVGQPCFKVLYIVCKDSRVSFNAFPSFTRRSPMRLLKCSKGLDDSLLLSESLQVF